MEKKVNMYDTGLLGNAVNYVNKLLNAPNSYGNFMNVKELKRLLIRLNEIKSIDKIEDLIDNSSTFIKSSAKKLKIIKFHMKTVDNSAQRDDNGEFKKPMVWSDLKKKIVLSKQFQIKVILYCLSMASKYDNSIDEFYTIEGVPRLKETLTMLGFIHLLEQEDDLNLEDFGNVDLSDLQNLQEYTGQHINKKFDSNSLTLFKRIDISLKKTDANLTEPLEWTGKSAINGEIISKKNTEIEQYSSSRIKLMDDDFISKNVMIANKQQEVFVYDAFVHCTDGTMKSIQVQSYHELEYAYYNIVGFLQTGKVSKENYIHCVSSQKIEGTEINVEDIIRQPGNHILYKTINFIRELAKKVGIEIRPGRSDAILKMQAMRMLYRFGHYDNERFCHSIYVGMKDAGKTYVTEITEAMMEKNYVYVTPGAASVPGIFGGSNQTVKLPNHTIPASTFRGAISAASMIVDEFTEESVDKNSVMSKEIFPLIKASANRPTVTLQKMGGGKVPRMAYLTFCGNYQPIQKIKLKDEVSKNAFTIAKSVRNKDLTIGESSDINLLNHSYDNSKFRDILASIDLFKNIEDYSEASPEDVIIKEAIVRTREHYRSIGVDMRTGIDFPVLKRFQFSLQGDMAEIFKEERYILDDEKIESLKKTDVEKLSKLHVSNLRNIFQKISDNSKKEERDDAKVQEFIDELVKKYKTTLEDRGSGTTMDVICKELMNYMDMEGEVRPSLETMKIIEWHLYTQANTLSSEEISNWRRLDKKVKYIAYKLHKEWKR